MIKNAKPCPFCRGRDLSFEVPGALLRVLLRVICADCGTDGPVYDLNPEKEAEDALSWTNDDALRLWNERAMDPATHEAGG